MKRPLSASPSAKQNCTLSSSSCAGSSSLTYTNSTRFCAPADSPSAIFCCASAFRCSHRGSHEHVVAGRHGKQQIQALARFVKHFRAAWTSQTYCAPALRSNSAGIGCPPPDLAAGPGRVPRTSGLAVAEGLMRTYSAGLTTDVESTAISSNAGTIIDGRRLINMPPDVRSCLREDMPVQGAVYPCNLRRAIVGSRRLRAVSNPQQRQSMLPNPGSRPHKSERPRCGMPGMVGYPRMP